MFTHYFSDSLQVLFLSQSARYNRRGIGWGEIWVQNISLPTSKEVSKLRYKNCPRIIVEYSQSVDDNLNSHFGLVNY